VAKVTYEAVGQIERFDERDTVFAREGLLPGSEAERHYHTLNPQLKETDERLRKFIDDKLDKTAPSWGRAYYQAVFSPIAHLALPDCVDGRPLPSQLGGSQSQNAQLVKSLAHYIGADLVGIGPLRQEWVYSHRGTRPFFESQAANPPLFEGMSEDYTGRLWGDAIEIQHRNAISLGFSQNIEVLRTGPGEASDLEIGRVYAKSALVACELASFIRSTGHAARAHHARNYCVLVVPVAVDAGLGELARCGHMLNKIYGLNVRLSCVTTDLPLEHDSPVDIGVQDFCNKCIKCAKNCPVGAIPLGPKEAVRGIRKWQIDPEKCLTYWSTAGAACVICQLVCPWTKPTTMFHKTVAHIASTMGWTRRALLFGDDVFYGTKYKRAPKPDWML
jgi:reductive dehalogenase